MRNPTGLAILALSLTAAAQGQPPSPGNQSTPEELFGQRGQVVITNEYLLRITNTSQDTKDSLYMGLQFGADYFVIDGLSVGGVLGYERVKDDESRDSENSLLVGTRVGYNIALGDVISIWPEVSPIYAYAWRGDDSAKRLLLEVAAPVLIHPASHFFLGAGPVFQQDLMNKGTSASGAETDLDKVQIYGLNSILGGWF